MSRRHIGTALSRVPPLLFVLGMAGAYTALFASLSVARHQAFWTGRFDLGNMVQAVWSTAQGRPLETTDVFGEQFVRLGAHVDPLLMLFAPLTWTGHLPEALLIAQALIVATGALPAYWLGRRWLGDARLGVAAAAVYLLYPPLQWAVLTDFHAVTLAAPLLMYCIWAAEERRWVVLGAAACLAALSKEQVGLALAMLGLWMAVRGARRAGALLAASGLTWSLLAVFVIIPRFNRGEGSAFVSRYSHLGADEGEVALTVVTRPWEVAALMADPARIKYVVAMLAPLLALPLLAPLLAAGALPDLAINLLSGLTPQHQIRFHYTAVAAPFLVSASILGLARLRGRTRPRRLAPVMARTRLVVALWVGVVALSGVALGPLPWWQHVPLGSVERVDSYRIDDHAAAAREAVALVPGGVAVSAGNTMGAHLSERRRILIFPRIDEADYIVVDRLRPYVGDTRDPVRHAELVAELRADPAWVPFYDRDGVMVLRRRGAP